MSRAFTKERDDAPAPEIVPKRTTPLVLTRRGLERRRLLLSAEGDAGIRALLDAALQEAVILEPPAGTDTVAPGAVVTVRGAARRDATYEIVSEDDVDVEAGRIGAESPLGRALLGKRVGDDALWQRPVGDIVLTIIAIDYAFSR